MKLLSTLTGLILLSQISIAQWIPLNSGTTVDLNDVDFVDDNNGLVGGDSGVLLITTNGGAQWSQIMTAGTSDIGAVKMVSPDTLIMSIVDGNNIPHLKWTYNAGIFWMPLTQDSLCFRPLDTDVSPAGKWASVGSSLFTTDDQGQNWDTLMNYTCNTNDINRLQATGNTFNGGGLISGFSTYSASMIRSDDGGNHFYGLDYFSFPNADALTAFDFPHPDTGYVFMNHYNNFTPGPINSVIQLTNFNLQVLNPGDTEFTFTSIILDTLVPSYMNDGKFLSSGLAFGAGGDGWIYKSTNNGHQWTTDYSNNYPVNRMSFPGEQTGYAVGDHGTIMKWVNPTSVEEYKTSQFSVFPNPANDYLTLSGKYDAYEIQNAEGKVVLSGKSGEEKVSVQNLSPGFYIIRVTSGKLVSQSRFVVGE